MRTQSLRLPAAALAALILAPAAWGAPPANGEEQSPKVKIVQRVEAMPKAVWGDNSMAFFPGRGYLGVILTQLTPELRAHFGASADAGVMVAKVVQDSPAAKAGIEVGDIVTAVDGQNITSEWGVIKAVRGREAGDRASLEIVRSGRPQTISITIEERDREQVDLGKAFNWDMGKDGKMKMQFAPGIHLGGLEGLASLGNLVDLSDKLKTIDWSEIAERTGRSTAELEQRIADLEKKLTDLSKRLEAATRER